MRGQLRASQHPGLPRWAARLGAALAGGLGAAAFAVLTVAAPTVAAATVPLPRIITLAPSTTELVFAAGAGAQIVGTVLSSDYPPAAREIPRIGDGIQMNTEAILALKPDIVLGWQRSGAARALAAVLEPLDISMVYVDPRSLADIPRAVRQLGERLGTREQAERAAAELERRIDALPSDGRALTVFLEISAEPLYTLGRDSLVNDLLTHCGATNLYADSPIAAPQISVESVLQRRPDALIVSPYGRETLAARREFWRALHLPAALAGHLYAIDPDWLHRPGPRMIDAAEALCADLDRARSRGPLPPHG